MQAMDLLFRYGLGPVTWHDLTVDHSFTGLFTVLSQMPEAGDIISCQPVFEFR
jgi:hypothetical protein